MSEPTPNQNGYRPSPIGEPQRTFADATPEIFDEIMQVNANGAFRRML